MLTQVASTAAGILELLNCGMCVYSQCTCVRTDSIFHFLFSISTCASTVKSFLVCVVGVGVGVCVCVCVC